MKVNITKRVYLNPNCLDTNILTHLLNRIIEITKDDCTKEHGHILSVNRIIKILNNEDTIFTVLFEAETLLPIEGSTFSGKVCMVYKDGIFLQILSKQKMLIPSKSITNYSYKEETNSYVNNNKTIKEGDEINVIVTASQYTKKNFSCIGKLDS
jgi:DNA-directed RNA polymerase subunit E'/Rpb7